MTTPEPLTEEIERLRRMYVLVRWDDIISPDEQLIVRLLAALDARAPLDVERHVHVGEWCRLCLNEGARQYLVHAAALAAGGSGE